MNGVRLPWERFGKTWDQVSPSEAVHIKLSTIFISIIVFKRFCVFEDDPCERRGMHEVQSTSKNKHKVFLVSKHFSSTSNAEESSDFGVGNAVRAASTTPAILGKRNRIPSNIDVDVKAQVEPHKSSRMANQV